MKIIIVKDKLCPGNYTYSIFGSILFVIDVTLDLALHLIKLSMETYEYPRIIKGLFLSINPAMDHHFVMTKGVGNMSLPRRRLFSQCLQLCPCLLFNVEFINVAEGILFTDRRPPEHDQTVVHLV